MGEFDWTPGIQEAYNKAIAELTEEELAILKDCIEHLEAALVCTPEEARDEAKKIIKERLHGASKYLKGAFINSSEFMRLLQLINHLLK